MSAPALKRHDAVGGLGAGHRAIIHRVDRAGRRAARLVTSRGRGRIRRTRVKWAHSTTAPKRKGKLAISRLQYTPLPPTAEIKRCSIHQGRQKFHFVNLWSYSDGLILR